MFWLKTGRVRGISGLKTGSKIGWKMKVVPHFTNTSGGVK